MQPLAALPWSNQVPPCCVQVQQQQHGGDDLPSGLGSSSSSQEQQQPPPEQQEREDEARMTFLPDLDCPPVVRSGMDVALGGVPATRPRGAEGQGLGCMPGAAGSFTMAPRLRAHEPTPIRAEARRLGTSSPCVAAGSCALACCTPWLSPPLRLPGRLPACFAAGAGLARLPRAPGRYGDGPYGAGGVHAAGAGGAVGTRAGAAGARLPAGGAAPPRAGNVHQHRWGPGGAACGGGLGGGSARRRRERLCTGRGAAGGAVHSDAPVPVGANERLCPRHARARPRPFPLSPLALKSAPRLRPRLQ